MLTVPVHNIILMGASEDVIWTYDGTRRLAEWRGVLGRVYIRWSLAIGGL